MNKGDKIVVLKDCPRLDYNDNTFVAAWKGDEGEYIGLANGTMHFCLVGKQCIKLRESEFEVVELSRIDYSKIKSPLDKMVKEIQDYPYTQAELDIISRNNNVLNPKHYESENDVIKFCLDNNIGFLEGNVIKYVRRWKEKNGIEDLMKAKEYIDRLIKSHKEQLLTEIIKEDEKDGLYDAENTREEGLPTVSENVD